MNIKRWRWIVLAIALISLFTVYSRIGNTINTLLTNNATDTIFEKLMPATFSADTESILDLMPDKLKERAIEDTKIVYEMDDDTKVPAQIGKTLTEWIDEFDTQFGTGWKYSYEVTDTYNYTAKEKKNLEACYKAMGVSDIHISKAQIKMVEYTVTAQNGTSGINTIPICLIKQNGKWYLGQSIGQVYEKMKASDKVFYELYGDLLDGFTSVGVVTEDNEVLMMEDFMEMPESDTETSDEETEATNEEGLSEAEEE